MGDRSGLSGGEDQKRNAQPRFSPAHGGLSDEYCNCIHFLKPAFNLLRDINNSFKKISDNLTNINYLIPAFFLLRTPDPYLSAARLVLSGQIPETYKSL